MSTVPKRKITVDEYLARERNALAKSEYFNGEIFAMAGGSAEHSLIAANISGEVRNALKGSRCNVFNSDLRVKVEETGLYTYPDVTVVCGEREFDDDHRDTLTNPTLIVEVLSPSTEVYDRGAKSRQYRRIESLKELLLVAQNSANIEQYIRNANGQWQLMDSEGLEAHISLPSLGVTISLAEIYRGVTFPPQESLQEQFLKK